MMPKRLLVFLIPAFIASLIYGYLQMPQQERVTTGDGKAIQRPQTKKQPQGQKSATIGSEGYPRLRSDLLERKTQPYPGVRRNLFSAEVAVSPREERGKFLPEEPSETFVPPVVAVAPPPPPPPPPTPQEIAQQELAHYKFVGFLKKGEKKTIFLSTPDEVFLARKGDYIGQDRKYYVVNITDTTLELYKDGVGSFSIKLTDQESLSPVFSQGQSALGNDPSSLRPVQEMNRSVQPEFMTLPDVEPSNEYQLQPEEVNQ